MDWKKSVARRLRGGIDYVLRAYGYIPLAERRDHQEQLRCATVWGREFPSLRLSAEEMLNYGPPTSSAPSGSVWVAVPFRPATQDPSAYNTAFADLWRLLRRRYPGASTPPCLDGNTGDMLPNWHFSPDGSHFPNLPGIRWELLDLQQSLDASGSLQYPTCPLVAMAALLHFGGGSSSRVGSPMSAGRLYIPLTGEMIRSTDPSTPPDEHGACVASASHTMILVLERGVNGRVSVKFLM